MSLKVCLPVAVGRGDDDLHLAQLGQQLFITSLPHLVVAVSSEPLTTLPDPCMLCDKTGQLQDQLHVVPCAIVIFLGILEAWLMQACLQCVVYCTVSLYVLCCWLEKASLEASSEFVIDRFCCDSVLPLGTTPSPLSLRPRRMSSCSSGGICRWSQTRLRCRRATRPFPSTSPSPPSSP